MENFDYDKSTDVQKLTHICAVTLDELKFYTDRLLDNFDIDSVSNDNLDIIANLLGYPIDKETDPDFRRRSLKNAVELYKNKGTINSIKVLFYNLGFNVDVVPLWTPDYISYEEIVPPYIIANIPFSENENTPGYYSITVINPDGQLITEVNSYQYI